MPTVITHAAVGLAVATAFRPARAPAGLFVLAALLPVVPDLDHWFFGNQEESVFSHRGATHSLVFAAAIGTAAALALRRGASSARVGVFAAILFLATALHGLLDAFTDGGEGIMLLWPFSQARIFWPVRPILVAPLSVSGFFTARGLLVFESELLWVWLPTAVFVLIAEATRRAAGRLRNPQ